MQEVRSSLGSSTQAIHPEILEAVVEQRLDGQQILAQVQVDRQAAHLNLQAQVCPDPLLMMTHLGQDLAKLPGDRLQRVSFCGYGPDSSKPTWIGFMNVQAFADPAPLMPAIAPHTVTSLSDFITEQSSWFTQAVKQNPRLHRFAKTSQQARILEMAKLLNRCLSPKEQLLDIFPVRYQRRTCSLVLTDQRLLCAGPTSLLGRPSMQGLALLWEELKRVELAPNGLRLHCRTTVHDLYFSVEDLDSLEIILAYFLPVQRRETLEEAQAKPSLSQRRVAGAGLVASLLIGLGWTTLGVSEFFAQHTSPPGNPLLQTSLRQDAAVTGLLETSVSANDSASASAVSPSQRCLEQFNQAIAPAGYAALNRATRTLLLHLERYGGTYRNGLEFDALANALAGEVFLYCDRLWVEAVRVEDGRYSLLKQR